MNEHYTDIDDSDISYDGDKLSLDDLNHQLKVNGFHPVRDLPVRGGYTLTYRTRQSNGHREVGILNCCTCCEGIDLIILSDGETIGLT